MTDARAQLADLQRPLRVAQRTHAGAHALLELARAQSAALSAGEVDQLSEIMQAREPLVSSFASEHQELQQVLSALPASVDTKSPAREQLRQLTREIDAALGEINERDSADAKALALLRQRLGAQLASTQVNHAARTAYSGLTSNAMYQDRRG